MRIAILADIHYSSIEQKTGSRRETGLADTILLRAVVRLNRLIHPDVTIVAGDLIHDGDAPNGRHDLEVVRNTLKRLQSPMLVIPGNHDGSPEAFHEVFPRPERIVQFGNVRFVVNDADSERPGYNSWRSPEEIAQIARARQGFQGHIVVLQHTPCFPAERVPECPYNYANAAEINAAESAGGVLLSLSGHFHDGFRPFVFQGVTYFAAPALCESPFVIPYVDLDETTGRMEWHREELKLPEKLHLVDTHIHTHLAFCSENLEIGKMKYLAELFGLDKFLLSEHSGHLIHPDEDYGPAQCKVLPVHPEECRGDLYFREMTEAGIPAERIGLETDIRFDGQWLAHPNDLRRAGFRIGAIHEMNCFAFKQNLPDEQIRDNFLWLCQKILQNGCLSMAHPFRIFRRSHHPIPEGCFAPLVRMLKEYNTAAEINFHTNEPPVEFFRMAINAGVKITLGSDTHNLYEIGDFALHLDFLRKCGVDGNYEDVLLKL